MRRKHTCFDLIKMMALALILCTVLGPLSAAADGAVTALSFESDYIEWELRDGTINLEQFLVKQPENAAGGFNWLLKTGTRYASLDQQGNLSPKMVGVVSIRATAKHGGRQAFLTVSIIDSYEVKGLTISAESKARPLILPIGETLQLSCAITPETAITNLKWHIKYDSIATVDQNGLVTPRREGSVSVRVYADNWVQDSIIVKVVKAGTPVPAEQPLAVVSEAVQTPAEIIETPAEVPQTPSETEVPTEELDPEDLIYLDEFLNVIDETAQPDVNAGQAETISENENVPEVPADDEPDSAEPAAEGSVGAIYFETDRLSWDLSKGPVDLTGTLQVIPADMKSEIRWEATEGTDVASVDEKGVLTPLYPGTVEIFAVTPEGDMRASMLVFIEDQNGLAQVAEAQAVVEEPEATEAPEVTAEPEITTQPEVTAEPEITTQPEATAEPAVASDTSVELRFMPSEITWELSSGSLALMQLLDIDPADANTAMVWTVLNEASGEVDDQGVFMPGGVGTVTVLAQDENSGATAEIAIQVVDTLGAQSIEINRDDEEEPITLLVGEERLFATTLTPEDAEVVMSWQSSDSAIAAVDDKGLVAASAPGKATISVTTSNGLTDSIHIVVEGETSDMPEAIVEPDVEAVPDVVEEPNTTDVVEQPNEPNTTDVVEQPNEPDTAAVPQTLDPLEAARLLLNTSETSDRLFFTESEMLWPIDGGEIDLVGLLEAESDALLASVRFRLIAGYDVGLIIEAEKLFLPQETGIAVVQASVEGEELLAAVLIQVVDSDVKNIRINPGTADRPVPIGLSNSRQFQVTLTPKNAYTTLAWVSSAPEIAEVDQEGMVIGRAAGEAEITVTAENGKSDTLTVVVNDNAAQNVAPASRR